MSMKKLALVTAMFAATSGAFAMEAMDEESLAATTGQDGITIGLATQANLDVIIHDKDGFTGRTDSGAMVISGIGLSDGAGGDALIDINIDAGASAALANDATLNINVSTGAIQMDLGTLSVANSSRTGAGVGWGVDAGTDSGALLNLGSITTAGVNLNIQLGDEPQGHLIVLDTTLTGGLTLTGVGLNDIDSLGSISVGTLTVTDNGGLDLTVDLGVDATATGLAVTVNQLGSNVVGSEGMTVRMASVVLGGGPAIGDIEINGLDLTGDVITISGH